MIEKERRILFFEIKMLSTSSRLINKIMMVRLLLKKRAKKIPNKLMKDTDT